MSNIESFKKSLELQKKIFRANFYISILSAVSGIFLVFIHFEIVGRRVVFYEVVPVLGILIGVFFIFRDLYLKRIGKISFYGHFGYCLCVSGMISALTMLVPVYGNQEIYTLIPFLAFAVSFFICFRFFLPIHLNGPYEFSGADRIVDILFLHLCEEKNLWKYHEANIRPGNQYFQISMQRGQIFDDFIVENGFDLCDHNNNGIPVMNIFKMNFILQKIALGDIVDPPEYKRNLMSIIRLVAPVILMCDENRYHFYFDRLKELTKIEKIEAMEICEMIERHNKTLLFG